LADSRHTRLILMREARPFTAVRVFEQPPHYLYLAVENVPQGISRRIFGNSSEALFRRPYCPPTRAVSASNQQIEIEKNTGG
jgi:hypothetical protein